MTHRVAFRQLSRSRLLLLGNRTIGITNGKWALDSSKPQNKLSEVLDSEICIYPYCGKRKKNYL